MSSNTNNLRLGKGLEALLGNVASASPAERPQEGDTILSAELQELADSIALHGVIQPILVTPNKQGRYTLVAGERRWRASRKAGLKEIPCIVRDMSDRALHEIALIENLQRVNLNPVEEAESISMLMKEYGLTQEAVSERVGKSRPAVANALRILSLPPEVLQMVRDGQLSSGHARVTACVKRKSVPKLGRKLKRRQKPQKNWIFICAAHRNSCNSAWAPKWNLAALRKRAKSPSVIFLNMNWNGFMPCWAARKNNRKQLNFSCFFRKDLSLWQKGIAKRAAVSL